MFNHAACTRKIMPIMLLMLLHTYYAKNYVGIIDSGLPLNATSVSTHIGGVAGSVNYLPCTHKVYTNVVTVHPDILLLYMQWKLS